MKPQTPKSLSLRTPSLWIWFYLLLTLPLSLWAAQTVDINTTLDRYTIHEGETVQLLIEAQGSLTGSPQLDPLNKDFEILGTSQSSSVSIINGNRQDSVRWQTTLSPRRSGQLSIPAIQVGKQITPALSLKVLPASSSLPQSATPNGTPSQTTDTSSPEVFLEVIVDNKQPYIQQQVLYTLRLFSEHPITGGDLTEPKADDLLVKRLGEDSNYRSQRNGRNYQVIERRYALFPQGQGKIKITSPVFDGKIAVPNTQRRQSNNRFGGLFDDVFGGDPFMAMRQSSKRVRLRGDSIELNVAAPLGDTATWLPASDVQLTETNEIVHTVKLGEPITRILRIQATGLSAAQLPALSLASNPDSGKYTPKDNDQLSQHFKSYPDKATLKDLSNGRDIVGTREQQWALIAQQPGKFTLPAIKLQWWNTQTQRQEIASLPARQIEVIAPAGYQSPATTQQATSTERPEAPPTQPTSQLTKPKDIESPTNLATLPNTESATISPAQRIKQNWLTIVFATLWIITLAMWLKARSSKSYRQPTLPAQKRRPDSNQSAKQSLKQLQKASNPTDARKAILEWGKSQYPENAPNGLTELANRLNNESIRETLREIDQALYASEINSSNGSELQGDPMQSVQNLIRELAKIDVTNKKGEAKKGDRLPELYGWER